FYRITEVTQVNLLPVITDGCEPLGVLLLPVDTPESGLVVPTKPLVSAVPFTGRDPKVLLGVVPAIAVDMVDLLTGSSIHDDLVHEDGLLILRGVIRSKRVSSAALLRHTPLRLRQPFVIRIVNRGDVPHGYLNLFHTWLLSTCVLGVSV